MLSKKSNNHVLVYSEVNFALIAKNGWWIDFGATIHINNNIQGFQTIGISHYEVYLQEHEFDIEISEDPKSFKEAKFSIHVRKLLNVIIEELKSMKDNDVWDLV